jgi:ribosomal protein L30/L7E
MTPEEKQTKLFMWMTQLYNQGTACIMTILINDMMLRPVIDENGTIWIKPSEKEIMKVLGLKRKQQSLIYDSLSKLVHDDYLAKVPTSKGMLYWINFDKLDELVSRQYEPNSVVEAMMDNAEYKASIEKYIKETLDATEEKKDGSI